MTAYPFEMSQDWPLHPLWYWRNIGVTAMVRNARWGGGKGWRW